MAPRSLRSLLAAASVDVDVDVDVDGITDDSRNVRPGWLFVAYRGVEVDGHRFIPDAIRRGAAAIVCERAVRERAVRERAVREDTEEGGLRTRPTWVVPNGRRAFALLCAAWHGFPSRSLVTIGVTGTDGKTTTVNLIHSILTAAGLRTGLISTVNAVIGAQQVDTGLHTTTPDADEFQDYLARMRDAGMTHAVLEVTSHGLQHHRVDGTDFDIAVVTNITHEHIDLHGSREAYRAAKARLFEMVGAGDGSRQSTVDSRQSASGEERVAKTAVLNGDDEFSFEYLRPIPVERRIVYTADPAGARPGWCAARDARHTPQGLSFIAATPIGDIALNSPLVGAFNVSNILAAVSAAIAAGVPAQAVRDGVAALRGVPGRMERIDLGQPFTAIVDFAHTPNALEQCLQALRPLTRGQLIVVFGCAGERDVLKRPLMGRVAARRADRVVLTAEDPRRESLESILDQIEAGMAGASTPALRVPDRAEALRAACALAAPGDIVVACGKGHEQSMCFGTTETPWDDRAAMRQAIKGPS